MLQQQGQRLADPAARLVASEQMLEVRSAHAIRRILKRPQNVIGHRIAQAVPEDVSGGRLHIFPQGKRRRQVVPPDAGRLVQQGIQQGQAHCLRFPARRDCPRQTQPAFRQVVVDRPPECPRRLVPDKKPCLPPRLNRRREMSGQRVQVALLQVAAFGQFFGAPRTHPEEAVGKTVPGLGAGEFPPQLVRRDMADEGDMRAGGFSGVVLGHGLELAPIPGVAQNGRQRVAVTGSHAQDRGRIHFRARAAACR